MKKTLVAMVLCLGAPSASAADLDRAMATERLRQGFPDAAVEVQHGSDRRFKATVSLPPDARRGGGGDPLQTAQEFLKEPAEALSLQGGGKTGSRVTTDDPKVKRLHDQIGEARVDGSEYIVVMEDGEVSRVSIAAPIAQVSDDLRRRAEAITTPEPFKAWEAVFDDFERRTGKDPRQSWFLQPHVLAYPIEELPADLLVIPESELLVYEVRTGPGKYYWVDAETFEVLGKRPFSGEKKNK